MSCQIEFGPKVEGRVFSGIHELSCHAPPALDYISITPGLGFPCYTTLSNWKVNDKCTTIEFVKIPEKLLTPRGIIRIGKLIEIGQTLIQSYTMN